MLQKPNAGLNTTTKGLWEDNRGGAFGVVILGLAISIAALLVLVNAVDFALYSYKRGLISKAIDYGVSAAVQEIDVAASKEGLAEGFDENGNLSMDNIFLHETRADNAFFSTFKENAGLDRSEISTHTLIAIVNPLDAGMSYKIKFNAEKREGIVTEPSALEGILNANVSSFWNTADPEADKHVIYVNGNTKTTQFKKRPYYLVFIKDYEIDGLFRKRTATFVGFKGAKVERKSP